MGASAFQAIAQHICAAVEHMHLRKIIHNDLKPENVFIALQNRAHIAKVGDFGGCCFDDRKSARAVTDYYSAPEAVLARVVNTKSDVYSVAFIAILLLTGQLQDSELVPLDCETYARGTSRSSFWTQAFCERRSVECSKVD